jgi:hypothetical protein
MDLRELEAESIELQKAAKPICDPCRLIGTRGKIHNFPPERPSAFREAINGVRLKQLEPILVTNEESGRIEWMYLTMEDKLVPCDDFMNKFKPEAVVGKLNKFDGGRDSHLGAVEMGG